MKPAPACSECKWVQPGSYRDHFRCAHPKRRDLVTGAGGVRCETERATPHMLAIAIGWCGVRGRFFEPITPPPLREVEAEVVELRSNTRRGA